MKQKEIEILALMFGKKVARIASFISYDNPEKSHTTISHSAQPYKVFKKSLKRDRKRTKDILKEVNSI